MNSDLLNIGETSAPRYEFRTFGHNFNESHEIMIMSTQPVPDDLQIRMFDEFYIALKSIDDINIKIKNNLLDIKKLLRTVGVTEQWSSVGKYEFPIDNEFIMNEIIPELQIEWPKSNLTNYDIKQFTDIVKHHNDLLYVPVQKRRYAYLVQDTICEYAEVLIDEEYLLTVAVESIAYEEVVRTINKVKLNKYKNINYLQAIKQVTGLSNRPFAN